MPLPLIDTDNWIFEFKVGERQKYIDPVTKDENFQFASSIQLLEHLANEWGTDGARFQGRIHRRLDSDANLRIWKRSRTFLKNAPSFNRYRQKPDKHNNGAASLYAGQVTLDAPRARQLLGEIGASHVVCPAGQMVFHGGSLKHSNPQIHVQEFLSTSLDPSVACWHANSALVGKAVKAVIWAIRVETEVPALWANTRKLKEYELLFPCGIRLAINHVRVGAQFDVVEAALIEWVQPAWPL